MKKSNLLFLIFDILIITISFLFFIYLKPASLTHYLPNYILPFTGFAILWFLASLVGNKYSIRQYTKISKLVSSILRVNFGVLAILLIAMYIFNSFKYSRLIVLGTIASTTILELIFFSFLFLHLKNKNGLDDPTTFSFKPKNLEIQQNVFKIIDPLKKEDVPNHKDSILHNLRNRYLHNQPDIFDFINLNLPLEKVRKDLSLVLDTNTFFNFENVESGSQLLFANLHKVNDYRRINQYFIQINTNLQLGGYFVGWGESNVERYNYFYNNFPNLVAFILYSGDSFWRRVIPKLPILKQFYFAITKGKNRALSKAEILGRLFYCGFNILALEEIDNKLYYIAQKVADPKTDLNPSYGPFIKMKRIGKDNEVLNVYKFRTMYPYSEYLQAYIHKENDLESGGKLKDDFRVTGWGKIFRRLWIDELPQFINFFRGELTLVGVRALSFHYFSLYPKDLQELRTQFKPGLVPPYYVDLPNSFEEIIESERKYLLKRQQKPFSTQIEYFFKAWWNILIKRARSK
jgi:lipopolysaccharide/colanic/teichoic acid biosynthesis glycosyltransferase